mmetsp:Transcript_39780/g.93186  ORF Transcript_39780/g.93186 Transcript_39780/m.93186 type:complete len:253 (+) Transcript_39780:187-945(+)
MTQILVENQHRPRHDPAVEDLQNIARAAVQIAVDVRERQRPPLPHGPLQKRRYRILEQPLVKVHVPLHVRRNVPPGAVAPRRLVPPRLRQPGEGVEPVDLHRLGQHLLEHPEGAAGGHAELRHDAVLGDEVRGGGDGQGEHVARAAVEVELGSLAVAHVPADVSPGVDEAGAARPSSSQSLEELRGLLVLSRSFECHGEMETYDSHSGSQSVGLAIVRYGLVERAPGGFKRRADAIVRDGGRKGICFGSLLI